MQICQSYVQNNNGLFFSLQDVLLCRIQAYMRHSLHPALEITNFWYHILNC